MLVQIGHAYADEENGGDNEKLHGYFDMVCISLILFAGALFFISLSILIFDLCYNLTGGWLLGWRKTSND